MVDLSERKNGVWGRERGDRANSEYRNQKGFETNVEKEKEKKSPVFPFFLFMLAVAYARGEGWGQPPHPIEDEK